MFLFTIQATSIDTKEQAKIFDNYIYEIAGGNKNALAELYEKTQSLVYGFALSICKNPYNAEDILQDVYVQIWNAAGQYNSEGKPLAWIFTITKNMALHCLRQQNKTIPVIDEELQSYFKEHEELKVDDKIMLEGLLEKLCDDERQIIILHALWGLKHREIANLLQKSLPTVLSKYNRAIKKLGKYIKEA